jgi:hypothetical protein
MHRLSLPEKPLSHTKAFFSTQKSLNRHNAYPKRVWAVQKVTPPPTLALKLLQGGALPEALILPLN